MFRGMLNAITGNKERELSQEEKTRLALNQAYHFEIALRAMDYVLDDNPDEGLAILKDAEEACTTTDGGDQTINTLAKGVIEFLEATLSFEGEEMQKAAVTLGKAEELSLKSRANEQNQNLKSSSMYPPGTVYAVTYTESCLLHALLMIFSESMVEAAKAVLKLRKSYYMLQEILNTIEKAHKSEQELVIAKFSDDFLSPDLPYTLDEDVAQNEELSHMAKKVKQMRADRLSGVHIGHLPASKRLRKELGLKNDLNVQNDQNDDEISTDLPTIDEFIYSGANLCFGILQVVLSLLPPAIGAVLSMIGYTSSRETGLRLVWKASKCRNVHASIGLLGLMFYYDGPFQFTDDSFDIPPKESNADEANGELSTATLMHPGHLLEESLLRARAFFPNGALWLLNEATLLSSKGRLKESVEVMDSKSTEDIHMRQVKSLFIFDRSITLIHLHEYERAAEESLSLLEISEWSHAFYSYFAGCCYLECYRMCTLGLNESSKCDYYRERAKELIFSSVDLLGKKTFKSKNLPLDVLVLRKVTQFKEMQQKLGVTDPLDAIGVSPIHEILYFYNGFNRMPAESLEISEKLILEFTNSAIEAKDEDQELIKKFFETLILRRKGKLEDGIELLDKEILPKFVYFENNKVKYIKKTEDPWLYPNALYERALFAWKSEGIDGLPEVKEWLHRAQNYADDYELSTRVSMKIKAAIDRLEHGV